MAANKKLAIGLFGFGVVGEGLYKVLSQTPSLDATIKKVCIKHMGKKRRASADLFTVNKNDILDDSEINVVVEVIDDADAAFDIVSTALINGKQVVSANKKMIAEHFRELLELQTKTGCSFLYEAAACASIPVIRNLEEYYDNDLLHSIRGIVNGSTNYILTKTIEEGLNFKEALLEAQQAGYAESNPTLDIDGFDAVNKWSFLLTHAFGTIEPAASLLFNGIRTIHSTDTALAASKKQQIKLVAEARKLDNGKLVAFVLPQFVKQEDPLAFVRNEYNGLVIESSFADKQFFYGKGAGSFPTASALLSDIAALRYQYKYEYKKLFQHQPLELDDQVFLRTYISFENIDLVPREEFEWIEEWNIREDRNYLVGVIALKKLKENNWWKENGHSLILTPEPIIQDIEIRKLKKKSLALAGV